VIYTAHQHYLCKELEEIEIGSACSTYRGENRFWYGNLKESRHLEEVCVHGRIMLKCILNKCLKGVDWVDLAQVGKKWQAAVTMVTDFRVP
jgi:hypothetical protein